MMRESIGGAWLIGIVMTFMAIFIAFIAITINYQKSYKLKTDMLMVIEQYEGINPTSVKIMNNLMDANSYKAMISCPRDPNGNKFVGVTGEIVTQNPVAKQNYCVYREKRSGRDGSEDKYYYSVLVTFKFSLPVLGDLLDFKVMGETSAIYYPNDRYF